MCVYIHVYECMNVSICVCMYLSMFCVCECMFLMNEFMHYVCMYTCRYRYIYV